MNFDDLKEKLLSIYHKVWDKIQESATYIQLRDRYESLPPLQQKFVLIGVGVLIGAIILSIPYGNLSKSGEHVTEFEEKRQLIRDLLKVSREASDVPNIPPAPNMDSLKASIESEIQNAHLVPEQIGGVAPLTEVSPLVPANLTQGGYQVTLSKLNLNQIINIGYQLQSISSSVKLKDIMVSANGEDPRYFDIVYKLIALAVPETKTASLEEEPGSQNGNDQNAPEEGETRRPNLRKRPEPSKNSNMEESADANQDFSSLKPTGSRNGRGRKVR
jgi:hypothetical protein